MSYPRVEWIWATDVVAMVVGVLCFSGLEPNVSSSAGLFVCWHAKVSLTMCSSHAVNRYRTVSRPTTFHQCDAIERFPSRRHRTMRGKQFARELYKSRDCTLTADETMHSLRSHR